MTLPGFQQKPVYVTHELCVYIVRSWRYRKAFYSDSTTCSSVCSGIWVDLFYAVIAEVIIINII